MPLSYNFLLLCTGGKLEILGCVQSAVAGESCTVTSSAYRSLLLASGTRSIFRITCATNPCQLATVNATASTATLSGCLVLGRRWITSITSILSGYNIYWKLIFKKSKRIFLWMCLIERKIHSAKTQNKIHWSYQWYNKFIVEVPLAYYDKMSCY